MDVNFFAPVRLTQALLPRLREARGRVVVVGSSAGALPGLAAYGAYASSKKALEGFVDALRQEVASHGVSVSLLQPAYVRTAMTTDTFAKYRRAWAASETAALHAAYPSVYVDAQLRSLDLSTARAPGPAASTTPDILHALLHPYPQTRYRSGTIFAVPGWLAVPLFTAMPDRMWDAFITQLLASLMECCADWVAWALDLLPWGPRPGS